MSVDAHALHLSSTCFHKPVHVKNAKQIHNLINVFLVLIACPHLFVNKLLPAKVNQIASDTLGSGHWDGPVCLQQVP